MLPKNRPRYCLQLHLLAVTFVMATIGSDGIGSSRCGILETRVRGCWYRVAVVLEADYLSVTLDESCETSTALNGGASLLNNNNNLPETPCRDADVPDAVANQKRQVGRGFDGFLFIYLFLTANSDLLKLLGRQFVLF